MTGAAAVSMLTETLVASSDPYLSLAPHLRIDPVAGPYLLVRDRAHVCTLAQDDFACVVADLDGSRRRSEVTREDERRIRALDTLDSRGWLVPHLAPPGSFQRQLLADLDVDARTALARFSALDVRCSRGWSALDDLLARVGLIPRPDAPVALQLMITSDALHTLSGLAHLRDEFLQDAATLVLELRGPHLTFGPVLGPRCAPWSCASCLASSLRLRRAHELPSLPEVPSSSTEHLATRVVREIAYWAVHRDLSDLASAAVALNADGSNVKGRPRPVPGCPRCRRRVDPRVGMRSASGLRTVHSLDCDESASLLDPVFGVVSEHCCVSDPHGLPVTVCIGSRPGIVTGPQSVLHGAGEDRVAARAALVRQALKSAAAQYRARGPGLWYGSASGLAGELVLAMPVALDPGHPIAWIMAERLSDAAVGYLPAAFVHAGVPSNHGGTLVAPLPHGQGSGVSLSGAIVDGLLDLVRHQALVNARARDAPFVPLHTASFEHPVLDRAVEQFCSAGCCTWIVDVPSSLGLPVLAALHADTSDASVTVGVAADPDPSRAAVAAVGNLATSLLSARAAVPACPLTRTKVSVPWTIDHAAPPLVESVYSSGPVADDDLRLRCVLRAFAQSGREVYVLDQTPAGLGHHVVHVLVPGLGVLDAH